MIWNDIKDKKPLAYLTGYWYGKKSDMLLVCTTQGKYFVAEMYEGVYVSGEAFCDFYEVNNDFRIEKVANWAKIDSPF